MRTFTLPESTTQPDVATVLNRVIAVCQDGESLYETGAENVHNTQLKKLFLTNAQLRRRAIQELAPLVKTHAAEVHKGGTALGALHQGYTRLVSFFSNKEQTFIDNLEECEDRTLNVLETALEKDLPRNIFNVLESQYEEFQKVHNNMSMLKKTSH